MPGTCNALFLPFAALLLVLGAPAAHAQLKLPLLPPASAGAGVSEAAKGENAGQSAGGKAIARPGGKVEAEPSAEARPAARSGASGNGGPALANSSPADGAGADEEIAPDSPRAAMTRFLEHCRKGEFEQAGDYLDLPRSQRGRKAELARRLKAVLDRHDWLDPDTLSPDRLGDRTDGLANLDRVGRIPGKKAGREDPVYIRRVGGERGWAFTTGTVRRIDGWYERLHGLWALEHLPEPLLRPGPRELLWWQWLALPLLIGLSWVLGMAGAHLAGWGVRRLTARTAATWDDELVRRLRGPAVLTFTLGAVYLLLPLLGLYEPAEAFAHRTLRTGVFLVFFWALLAIADVSGQIIETWPWARANAASKSLILLGVRAAKVVVLAMAVIAILSEFGYPVASLVAGLGIGGLALALASQKTVEHMFGAVSLGVDQPFRVGDLVKIEDLNFIGTVEVIGLRSTRIRTLDRTLITIPNGKLAEMRIESLSARDRMRLSCLIGLTYDTTADQMREVLEGLERVLRQHPKIWPDDVSVRFFRLGESSLDIEVTAYFNAEWPEFTFIRQEILLAFLEVIEKAGASFAFPTRTVHLAHDSNLPHPGFREPIGIESRSSTGDIVEHKGG